MLLTPAILELEQLRGSRVIIYFIGDNLSKHIDNTDVPVIYECLKSLASVSKLDVILQTKGGFNSAAYRIALLLREYAPHINILVPYQARSAGTLICLAANQLVLSPLSELSPLDPYISSSGDLPVGTPTFISAEDIRALKEMAEAWFGIDTEEYRLHLFTLVSQRIFPASLGLFYRAHVHVREIANQLLAFQLPEANPETRELIVNKLISGYRTHDYSITRSEAKTLGLQISFATAEEERLMWDIYCTCRDHMASSFTDLDTNNTSKYINGLILGGNYIAEYSAAKSNLRNDQPNVMNTAEWKNRLTWNWEPRVS